MRFVLLAVLVACRAPREAPRDADPPRDAHIARDAAVARPFALMPCDGEVLGRPFRGGTILCIAFQAASITSVAVEDPSRREEAAAALDRLAELALAPGAKRAFPANSVLYRGLVALVLAGLERVAPDNPRSARFDAIVADLARDLEGGWLSSYRGETYPCDHAPAAAALRLHALLRGSSPAAADRLAERLGRALERGFPTSTADRTERATTLAFTAAFLLPGEPELAARFADRFVTFCDRAPVAACREWRTPHRPDAASGPIIAGYSVGATALGLPATRQHPAWHAALMRTAMAAGAGTLDGKHALEASLLEYGETARSWR